MSLAALVQPFSKFLRPPTALDPPEHASLSVCEDCVEAFELGLLDVDLDRRFPVQWKKVAGAPAIATNIALLQRAQSVSAEGLAAEYDVLFYLVGAGSNGSLIVQVSGGEHRGKLAMVSESAQDELASFDASRSTVDVLVEAKLLEVSPISLREYLELRLANTPKPKALIPKDKSQKALAKAIAAMDGRVLSISGVEDFAFDESLGDLSQVHCLKIERALFETLPESIAKLPQMRRLFLEDCPNVRSIPSWLTDRLESLWIDGCPFESLPAMPNLQSLTLSHVPMTSLGSMARYPSLKSLRVSGAAIESLPADIGDARLLDEVCIDKCWSLRALPDSIGSLAQLTTLEVYDTSLESVPDTIGSLARLDRLVLGTWGRNQLRSLHDSVGNLSKLTLLWLGRNKIRALPDSLARLSELRLLALDDNQLEALPEWIFSLPKLIRVDFSYKNNPIPAKLDKEYRARLKAKR